MFYPLLKVGYWNILFFIVLYFSFSCYKHSVDVYLYDEVLWCLVCVYVYVYVCIYVISIYLPGRMTLLCNILLCNSFCLKVYFVRYKISHFCSLLFIIYMEYLFLSLAFQLMCVLKFKVSLLLTKDSWILCFYPFSQCVPFYWRVNHLHWK